MKETVEQYMARGGKVSKHPAANPTTSSDFIKKDTRIKELRKLKTKLTNPEHIFKVELAIQARIDILK